MDKIVAGAAIFDGIAPRCLAAARKQLRPVRFAAGEMVLAEGAPGDRLYIIKSGHTLSN